MLILRTHTKFLRKNKAAHFWCVNITFVLLSTNQTVFIVVEKTCFISINLEIIKKDEYLTFHNRGWPWPPTPLGFRLREEWFQSIVYPVIDKGWIMEPYDCCNSICKESFTASTAGPFVLFILKPCCVGRAQIAIRMAFIFKNTCI